MWPMAGRVYRVNLTDRGEESNNPPEHESCFTSELQLWSSYLIRHEGSVNE